MAKSDKELKQEFQKDFEELLLQHLREHGQIDLAAELEKYLASSRQS